MKRLLLIIFSLAALALFIIFWQIWQNNRETGPATYQDIKLHFDRSVSWLESSYGSLENTDNPILWWMIKEAASNSGDITLDKIYSTYKANHLDNRSANLSTPMFDKFYRPKLPDLSLLRGLRDYQLFFFYALSCDTNLGSEPVIQRQLVPQFCSLHYLHPRCITHQLMGLRFMQRYQCGYDDTVAATISALQKILISELTWDFRIGDAYIQRVLMLVDTGAYNETRPVWIKNILNAQNNDGSWDDLHPVLYLGNDFYLGFTSMWPAVKKQHADFHATAQAIWLLSLLLKEAEIQEK
jgi:hypothetical protein